MNSRQRVHRAINMTGPDRTPVVYSALAGAVVRHAETLEELYRRYPSDVVTVGAATTGQFGPEIGVASRDPWGCLWVRPDNECKGRVTHHPLADWGALDDYEPPDLADEKIINEAARRIEANAGERYTTAEAYTLWQRMYYLHGFAATVEDLLLAPDRSAQLRDMVLGVLLARIKRLGQLGDLDGVRFCEGWGTQRSLLIGAKLWRTFFKPVYAQLFDAVHRSGKHVWLHCFGRIEEIIPDLIEIGVDVLHVQTACMDRAALRSLTVRKVCVMTDIDRQQTLPEGSAGEVRAAVRADMETFVDSRGGLIAYAKIGGDVPLENIEAMLDEMIQHES